MTDRIEWQGLDLTEQTRRVRALAQRLVGDPNEADDVAQQAWVLRAERAAAGGAERGGDAVRWLGGVMRNLASRHRRGEGRRKAREHAVARPEATASTLDAVAHAEMLQRVVQAVLALEEPYRGTLLLRYLQDLPPAAVAERLGVPESTVRVRAMRGLQRLRGRLRRELGPDATASLLAFALGEPLAGRPLAGRSFDPSRTLETQMTGREKTPAPVPAKATHGAKLAAGIVGCAVVAGAAALWLVDRGRDGGPVGKTAVRARSGDGAAASTSLADGGSGRPAPALREPVPDGDGGPGARPAPAAEAPVSGVVLDPEGRPVAGARVEVTTARSSPWTLGERVRFVEAFTDTGGVFRATGFRGDTGTLLVDAPGYAPWRGRLERAPARTRPRLAAATRLSGVIRDPSGAPLAGVLVVPPALWLDRRAAGAADEGVIRWRPPVVTDAAGRYRLARVPVHERFVLRIARPGTLPAAIELRVRREPAVRDFVVDRDALGLHVSSAAGERETLAGARVRSVGLPSDFGSTDAVGRLEVPVTVPAAGRTAAREVSDELEIDLAGYGSTSVVLVSSHLAAAEPVRAQLVPTLAVRGRVIDAAGRPVGGASVRWKTAPTRRLEVGSRALAVARAGEAAVRADGRGRFTIPMVLPGAPGTEDPWKLRAFLTLVASTRDGLGGETVLTSEHQGEREQPRAEIRVAPRTTVSGTVRLADREIPDVRVRVEATSGETTRSTRVGADGSWALFDLPAGTWELRPALQNDIPVRATSARIRLEGTDRHGIELAIDSEPARLRGRVVDAVGRPRRGAEITVMRAGPASAAIASAPAAPRGPSRPMPAGAAEPAAGPEGVAFLDDVEVWATQTDGEGRFVVALPAADAGYDLQVRCHDGSGLRRTLQPDEGRAHELIVPRLLPVFVDVGLGAAGDLPLRGRFEPVAGAARELPAFDVVDGSLLLDLPQGHGGTLVLRRGASERRVEVDLSGSRARVGSARVRF